MADNYLLDTGGNLTLGGKISFGTTYGTVTQGSANAGVTLNSITGSVTINTGSTSCVVTNSYCSANSIVFATTDYGGTALTAFPGVAPPRVAPAAGSFGIYFANGLVSTAGTAIRFFILNPVLGTPTKSVSKDSTGNLNIGNGALSLNGGNGTLPTVTQLAANGAVTLNNPIGQIFWNNTSTTLTLNNSFVTLNSIVFWQFENYTTSNTLYNTTVSSAGVALLAVAAAQGAGGVCRFAVIG